MPRDWLAFWNQELRRQQRAGTVWHSSGADVWVPYGQDKLAVRDSVYCVGVARGQLLLFGRLKIGRMAADKEHPESLDLWAEPGTESSFRDDRIVPRNVVDELVYVKATGAESRFVRRPSGGIDARPFQGRASICEILSGALGLEQAAQD